MATAAEILKAERERRSGQTAPAAPADARSIMAAEKQRRLEAAVAAQASRDADMVPTGGEGPAPQPQERGAFDRTGDALSEGLSMAGTFAKSLVGGESPTANAIPKSVPLYSADGPQIKIPEWARQSVGRVGDVLMVPLSVATAAMGGVAGAVGDVADLAGMEPNNADRLARDLNAMPEAFAGSPNIAATGARTTRAISRAVPDTPNARPAAGAVPPPARPTAGAAPLQVPEARPIAVPPKMLPADEIAGLSRSASNGGAKNQTRLAESMDVNPDRLAAAQRVGVELPADVFSDNPAVRQTAGLGRSQVGSVPSAQWETTVNTARNRATDVMTEIGGSADISLMSTKVRGQLDDAVTGLEAQSNAIYNTVNDQMPKNTQVDLANTRTLLKQTADDLGGTEGMSALERDLFNISTGDAPVTYARLNRLRADVGDAAFKGKGPYKDASSSALEKIYGALNDDQISNVATVGGEAMAADLRLARSLVSERKTLEQQIVGAFGKDLEGSIAGRLRTAMASTKKGDDGGFNRMMNVIPENLRGEAILTGLTSLIQSNRAAEPGFGFPEFAKMMEGVTNNSVIARRIETEVGPVAWRTMKDLADVSRTITDARANVLTTGKANQQILEKLVAENFIGKIIGTSSGSNAARSAGAGAGAIAGSVTGIGSPAGAVGGSVAVEALMSAISKTPAQRQAAIGALFNEPKFNQMVFDFAEKGTAAPEIVTAATNTPAFRRWARVSGIDNPETWVAAAILGSVQGNQESANPEENAQSGQP
jgi:hypothetical protein